MCKAWLLNSGLCVRNLLPDRMRLILVFNITVNRFWYLIMQYTQGEYTLKI